MNRIFFFIRAFYGYGYCLHPISTYEDNLILLLYSIDNLTCMCVIPILLIIYISIK